MLKKLDISLIEKILQKARESPRKRAIYCFHNSDENLQRMINAGLSDTYVQPHKHENPDKLEIFSILKGIVSILIFDDNGKIIDSVTLDENGHVKLVEIQPKTWHTFVILSDEAALYEIIEGKYDSKIHKNLAPWAPEENFEEAKIFLKELKNKLNFLKL